MTSFDDLFTYDIDDAKKGQVLAAAGAANTDSFRPQYAPMHGPGAKPDDVTGKSRFGGATFMAGTVIGLALLVGVSTIIYRNQNATGSEATPGIAYKPVDDEPEESAVLGDKTEDSNTTAETNPPAAAPTPPSAPNPATNVINLLASGAVKKPASAPAVAAAPQPAPIAPPAESTPSVTQTPTPPATAPEPQPATPASTSTPQPDPAATPAAPATATPATPAPNPTPAPSTSPSPAPATPAETKTVTISYDGQKFTTTASVITLGDTLEFINKSTGQFRPGCQSGPVTSCAAVSPLGSGGSWSFKPSQAGTYVFANLLDPTQSISITVAAPVKALDP